MGLNISNKDNTFAINENEKKKLIVDFNLQSWWRIGITLALIQNNHTMQSEFLWAKTG